MLTACRFTDWQPMPFFFFLTKSPLFFAGSDAVAAQPLGWFAVGMAGSWQVWAVADPAGGEMPPSAELCRGGHARVYLHTSVWLSWRLPVPVPASPLAEFQRRYVSCGEKELFMPGA